MPLLTNVVIRLLIFCLSLVFSLASCADEFDNNLKAYQQGDYQTAFEGWRNAAQQGDIDADYHLGELYRLGQGVHQDNLKAESSYLKAAQNNHVLAQLNLGKLYYSGALGVNQKQKAFYWLSQAAEQNNPEAQWMMGGMLFNGEAVVQDSVAAYSWLTLASDQNHLQAALNQARIKPYLSAEELGRADKLTAAFKQNMIAQRDIQEQQQKAFYWFHKAAQQNDAHAQWMVGNMLLNGQGVAQDKVAAYSWLTLASEQNQSGASLKLAQLKSELSQQQISLGDSLTATFKQQGSALQEESQANPSMPQQKKRNEQHYRVQVASFTSLLDVDIELIELKKRFPEVMTEHKVTITEPNLDLDKADFYRIQLGAFNDKAGAKKLCQDLARHEQACFVVKVVTE